MAELERRFWDRVGMYVTKEFAEEWIEKMSESSSTGGKHLDDDIEEYIVSMPPTSVQLGVAPDDDSGADVEDDRT